MRVAVVDIGTNSTRLLIADVDSSGTAREVVRRSTVTRLGDGVDASGSLSPQAIARVLDTLAGYRREIDSHDCHANLAVLTSAVRDAVNGSEFAARVREEYQLDARVLTGEEEAQLTFLGAMSDRPLDDHDPDSDHHSGPDHDPDHQSGPDHDPDQPTLVIDIGGGSTEFVVGRRGVAGFHVSLPAGVVRMSERHIHSDPPAPSELQSLARDVRSVFLDGLPPGERAAVRQGVAVGGTATSSAAIELELDPYDSKVIHGYHLQLATVELLLARLADMSEADRRDLVGLHPDRAPTIVAGMILLEEAMRAFELTHVEVSERDILFGGALRLAAPAAGVRSDDPAR